LPYRVAPAEAGQFRFMGRAMNIMSIIMSLKMAALMLGAGMAVAIGALGYWIGGGSFLLAGTGAAATLAGEALAESYVRGRVFGSYDVDKDVAG
jgi:hypothetical protein